VPRSVPRQKQEKVANPQPFVLLVPERCDQFAHLKPMESLTIGWSGQSAHPEGYAGRRRLPHGTDTVTPSSSTPWLRGRPRHTTDTVPIFPWCGMISRSLARYQTCTFDPSFGFNSTSSAPSCYLGRALFNLILYEIKPCHDGSMRALQVIPI
jgi:hypothetical protein